jgi:hypothetical protein
VNSGPPLSLPFPLLLAGLGLTKAEARPLLRSIGVTGEVDIEESAALALHLYRDLLVLSMYEGRALCMVGAVYDEIQVFCEGGGEHLAIVQLLDRRYVPIGDKVLDLETGDEIDELPGEPRISMAMNLRAILSGIRQLNKTQ